MYSSDITKASNFVQGVDTAFLVILGISFIFLIGLTAVMIYFVYKYNKKRNPKATQIEGSVKLEIFDSKGAKVSTLCDEWMSRGWHKFKFSANHLSSGVYFYRIKIETELITRKMLLLR